MPASATLPKYIQISERLIRDIAAGHLADGARLPPEREMASNLGLSVGTLRKALAVLADKGLLVRVQGSGNYIRHVPGVASVYGFLRLELRNGGGLPTARVLAVDRLPKPADAPVFGPDANGWRIRRLRRLDGIAVAVEEIWLDAGCAARLAPGDLSESLYLYYRDRLGLIIAAVEDRVGLRDVPDWAPLDFAQIKGTPCAHITRLSRDGAGARVEFSRTWFDCNKARYISRMGKG